MKKTMLYSTLLSLLSLNTYAELTDSSATNPSAQNDTIAAFPFDGGINSLVPHRVNAPTQLAQNDAGKTQKTLAAAEVPATTPTTPATPPAAEPSAPASIVPDTKASPTSTTPISPNAPAAPTTPTTSGVAPQTAVPVTIDCNYHIPANTKVEQTVILKWAEKAVQQSFEFDHQALTQQLSNLKVCYTDQGWQSFNDALNKSGNMDAIKSQNLIVSSMIQGTPTITEIKDNQWKASLPLQVVYQNDKDKLTQSLTVDLIIGRKLSGDLGIMQIIASPRANQNTPAPIPQ